MKSEIKKRLISLNSVLLILIIGAGFFFRFYNTPQRYGFDQDPARDGVIAQYGAQHLQFPLIGPHSGVADFTFGPWYYYQIIGAELLIPFDYAPWIYLGIISTIFIYIMYLVGKELKNTHLGLTLAFFAALSPSITGPTSGLSNPSFIPFFAALYVLLFLRTAKSSKLLYAFFWGAAFGIGVSHHYQMAGLLLLLPATVLFSRKNWIKKIGLFLAGALLVLAPMVAFDLVHNWYNTSGVISYLTGGHASNYIPNNWRIYIFDFWIPFYSYILGAPKILAIPIGVMCAGILSFFAWKKMISNKIIIILLVFTANFLMLRYYGGEREYYYYLYLVPLVIIFVGYSLLLFSKIKHGWVVSLVALGIMLPFLLKEDVARLSTRGDHVEFTQMTQFLAEKYPDEKFVFYQCMERDINRVYAFNYILNKEGLLDEDGRKIGFTSEQRCTGFEESGYKKNTTEIPEIEGYDLSDIDENELFTSGWEKITPMLIYSDTVMIKNTDKH